MRTVILLSVFLVACATPCPQRQVCVSPTITLTAPDALLKPCEIPQYVVETNGDLLDAYLGVNAALWECANTHNHLVKIFNEN